MILHSILHLPLAVMGWDDLLMAIASAVASQGVQGAMSMGKSSKQTTPVQVPQMAPPPDPMSLFSNLTKQKGGF